MYRVGVVSSDPMRMGIHVVIGIPGESGGSATAVTSLGNDDGLSGLHFVRVESGVAPPTIFFPDDIALPLLDALAAHYGGSGDTRALRKDYSAERARVDILIEALIEQGRGQVVLTNTGEVL